MASPPHLLRCEVVDIVLRGDGGFRGLAALGNKALPKGEFQKVAAFHHISPLRIMSDEFRRDEMNAG
jgi:hypothetical protein